MGFLRIVPACIVIAFAALPPPAHAEARSWSETFAAVRDTVVFFTPDGALLKAPFHLATRETLWTPAPGRQLVRASASPDGARIAWLERAFDGDTTRLWIHGRGGTVLRLRYFALQARRHQFVHTEPEVPSIEDGNARGARFVEPGPRMRRNTSNALAWTPDGRTIVVGYDGGVAAIPADGGPGTGLAEMAPISLAALHPAPMFLADAVQLAPSQRRQTLDQLDLNWLFSMDPQKHAAGRASYVLTVTPGGWHAYPVAGLDRSRARAAGPRTVWWSEGRTVRAMRAGDPGVTEEFTAADRIVWLGFDGARDALLWVSERQVGRRSGDGSSRGVVVETRAPIRSVLETADGGTIGLVTDDSLLVWSPADDSVLRLDRAGLNPCALLEASGGRLLAVSECNTRAPLRLAELDRAAGRLLEIETPRVHWGAVRVLPGGDWILLYDPTPRSPRMFHAYDVRSSAWVQVENPGVGGWERVGAVE